MKQNKMILNANESDLNTNDQLVLVFSQFEPGGVVMRASLARDLADYATEPITIVPVAKEMQKILEKTLKLNQ